MTIATAGINEEFVVRRERGGAGILTEEVTRDTNEATLVLLYPGRATECDCGQSNSIEMKWHLALDQGETTKDAKHAKTNGGKGGRTTDRQGRWYVRRVEIVLQFSDRKIMDRKIATGDRLKNLPVPQSSCHFFRPSVFVFFASFVVSLIDRARPCGASQRTEIRYSLLCFLCLLVLKNLRLKSVFLPCSIRGSF
jgi:hypothetical protein